MPSPRDCKATMLQGSGTVQVTDGSPRKGYGSPKKGASVQFFIESALDSALLVQPQHKGMCVDLKTENEYWTQSSNMSSLDTRGELIRHKDSGRGESEARKQRDLQSQVLGGSSKTSLLGLAPAGLPLSAREYKANDMATSEESPLSARKPVQPTTSMSPRSTIVAFRDSTNDASRRSDSQFTDLRSFDMPAARSPRRSEMHDVATTYWANSTTEISRKNAQRQQRRGGQEGDAVETAGTLIHQSSPRLSMESEHCRKIWQDERVCSGSSGMQASAEIARRRRELQSSKSMGDLPSPTLTASERKRVDLASGQVRLAAGIPLKKHDDGSPSSWASPRSMRATVTQPACAKSAVRSVMHLGVQLCQKTSR
ncbi:unnamed protein product [Symbiodinium natans]|uniref:Uncharacterized protein n=1 Tax=Symbiodinium natans TaxID=878477 RepID=A0A812V4M1_9DINO|nr:unnamed protein product [Symbiodinium natans]